MIPVADANSNASHTQFFLRVSSLLFFYTAYGYTFKSDIDLPGFCQLQRNTDHPIISINRKAPWSPAFPLTTAVTSIRVTDGITIHWRGVASYDIRRGRSITIAPSLAPGPLSKLEIQPLYGICNGINSPPKQALSIAWKYGGNKWQRNCHYRA